MSLPYPALSIIETSILSVGALLIITDTSQKSDLQGPAQTGEIPFESSVKRVFIALVFAKQFIERAENDQLNLFIADWVQRIDVEDRADMAGFLLRDSNSFVDSTLAEIGGDQAREACNFWSAVFLLEVRHAMKKGIIGDLGINWDTVKDMFDDESHRKILDKEEKTPSAATTAVDRLC